MSGGIGAGSVGVWPAHHLPLAAMEANANTSNCRRSHAMAGTLTIWTYDWVPAGTSGFVRDLRLRWAEEDAGLAHYVRTVTLEDHETTNQEQKERTAGKGRGRTKGSTTWGR